MFETHVRTAAGSDADRCGWSQGQLSLKRNMTLGRPIPRSKWETSCRIPECRERGCKLEELAHRGALARHQGQHLTHGLRSD
jgi:hypothetical protein